MSWRDVVATVLLICGGVICLFACLGAVVMRNAFDRLHYVGPVSFGALLVAIAIVVQESFSLIGNKALAVAALLLLGGPVVSHVTARTARIRERDDDWRSGIESHREVQR